MALDRTSEIIQLIARDDQCVMLLKQANKGVVAARNLAIGKCKGQYRALLDADDIWYPESLDNTDVVTIENGS